MALVTLSAANQYLLNKMNGIANQVRLGDLLQGALTPSSQPLASGLILVGSAGGVETAVALSGDATLANTGVLTLATSVKAEATGVLTQANIVAMNGAAVNLIPAPGAGKFIYVEFMELFHSYSTAAYTGGGVIAVQYTGSTVITKSAATLITGASSESDYQRPTLYDLDNTTGTAKGLSVAGLVNLGVEITNATAVFAAGNAANVLKWRIRYKVMTLLT